MREDIRNCTDHSPAEIFVKCERSSDHAFPNVGAAAMSGLFRFVFALLAIAFAASAAEAQTVPASGQIKSNHSGYCVSVAGGSTTPGVRTVQAPCRDVPHQLWDFRPDPLGGYRIVSRNSALCLDVKGGSLVQGTLVVQETCAAVESQRWTVEAAEGAVQLKPAHSGQCLEIGNGATSPGANLNQWSCANVPQNKWTLLVATPQNAFLVTRVGGMCATPTGGSTASGAALVQATCRDLPQLVWELRPATPGAYQFVNRNSGLCLAVNGASTADGATLVQSPCVATAPSQAFALRPVGDDVELVAAHSGKCLENKSSMNEGAELIQWTCNGGAHQKWAVSGPGAPSAWTAPISTPIIAVAASTLRNGKVLMWSSHDRFTFGGGGRTYTAIFDPETGVSSEAIITNTGHDMFCPGTSTLPDGRIMVSGGSGNNKVSVYDPATNIWTAERTLNVGRGYQGDTVLPSGDVLTVGGSWSGGQGGKIAEVWNRPTGWRTLPNVSGEALATADPAGVYRADNHMWLYGAVGNRVFHAGPSAEMHWISTKGDGEITSAGLRGDDADAINGNAVMYDAGKVLKLGGAPAYDNGVATTSAYTIDFSRGPARPVSVVKQKPMTFPRAFANAVVLPSGEVVVVGGHAVSIPFSDARSMMAPEIWSPQTGAFTRLASMAVPRNYHSIALLMRDGRVFAAGGGQCGSGCAGNHFEAEILTPPYLLNADGTPARRPTITAAPSRATWGETISVATRQEVASFAIVRLGATTHTVNNDQRRLPLPILSASGLSYELALPSDKSALIAGEWMLFAMNAQGTPSVAKILHVK